MGEECRGLRIYRAVTVEAAATPISRVACDMASTERPGRSAARQISNPSCSMKSASASALCRGSYGDQFLSITCVRIAMLAWKVPQHD
eukprot:SAG11_NODE_636_length_8034_cov_5.199118_13_plen_88_part_00